MASASAPYRFIGCMYFLVHNEPAKDLILVHTVQLESIIKAHFSGRMVSIGISDIAFASIYSEKTRLKKLLMKMIILIIITVNIVIITINKSQQSTVLAGARN